MPLLTKPVRNLLLAAMFAIAMGLVETRAQEWDFPACFVSNMSCMAQGGDLQGNEEGEYCHGEPGGFILSPFDCFEMGTDEILFSGWCFLTDVYGNRIECEG